MPNEILASPGIGSAVCYSTVCSGTDQRLEQLERLRSEDTAAALWLSIPLSHIGSQVKRRQSQSYRRTDGQMDKVKPVYPLSTSLKRGYKNTKAPRHWPLWGESTGNLWIPKRASNAEDVFIWWLQRKTKIRNNLFSIFSSTKNFFLLLQIVKWTEINYTRV